MSPTHCMLARVVAALGPAFLLQACCSLGEPIDASWYYLPESKQVVVGLRNRSAEQLSIISVQLDRAQPVIPSSVTGRLPPRELTLFAVTFDHSQCALPRFVKVNTRCGEREFKQRIEFADRMPADLPPWIRSPNCIRPTPNPTAESTQEGAKKSTRYPKFQTC